MTCGWYALESLVLFVAGGAFYFVSAHVAWRLGRYWGRHNG